MHNIINGEQSQEKSTLARLVAEAEQIAYFAEIMKMEGLKRMNETRVIPGAELQAKIAELEAENVRLSARVADLETALAFRGW